MRYFYILLVFVSWCSFAGERNDSLSYCKPTTTFELKKPEIFFNMGAFVDINNAQLFTGFNLGAFDVENYWSANIDFLFSPIKNKVLIEENSSMLMQLHEKRYMFALTLEKYYLPFEVGTNHMGGYVEASGGWNWGSYAGTTLEPERRWVLSPGAGFALSGDDVAILMIGYSYFDCFTKSSAHHQVSVGLTFVINTSGL